MYDFRCDACGYVGEELTDDPQNIACPQCHESPMTLLMSAPRIFTTIVPTYPGSKYLKAGYQHHKDNRPATRIQSGYGGCLSPDNPKK
jgi:putative FmdB family regulatory protein